MLGHGGGAAYEEAIDDVSRWGLPEHLADRLRAAAGCAPTEGVWRANLPAFDAFSVAASQWRCVGGFGGFAYIGLDYAGAEIAWRRAGIEMTPDVFADVQVMEEEATAALNGRR